MNDTVTTGRGPALLLDIDVAEPIPAITARDVAGAGQAHVLVRRDTQPLGLVVIDLPEAGLSAAALSAAINPTTRTGTEPASLDEPSGYLARRGEVLRDAPPITVVICTRDRAESLRASVDSVLAQAYPRFRILIVDNAPSDASTRAFAQDAAERSGLVDYLVEPRPGLSRARNAAIDAVGDPILAFLDDDAVADPHWLAEIARAFADVPEADAVSGPILPAAIATPAQVWFEQYGGHTKGRGFTRAVIGPATAREQNPLYPLPPVGAGGNMAFRRRVFDRIGGFDPALGAGTVAMGSEDTHIFMRLLRADGTVVYQPGALVRHHNRPDLAGLRRQMLGYGTGLTAAYTSMVLHDPTVLIGLLRLAPTALRDLMSRSGQRTGGLPADFPPDLLATGRRGLLRGPLIYLRSRHRLWRDDAQDSAHNDAQTRSGRLRRTRSAVVAR